MPRIRQQILAATMLHPERAWFGAELARHLGVARSSLQRELASLADAGLLERSSIGRNVQYRANTRSPLFGDLQGLLRKTAGVVEVLREALAPFAERIEAAFVSGSVARGAARDTSDVDLLVVGPVRLRELTASLAAAEAALLRPVHANVWPVSELRSKLRDGEAFARTLASEPKLFVIGSERDLEVAGEPAPRGVQGGRQE